MLFAHLGRIKVQLFGNLVDLNFQRKSRLWCSVAAFWSAGWFVCKRTQTAKSVTRYVVRYGLQRSGIKRRGNAVASIRTSIQERLKIHRCDSAVFLYAGFDFHQDGMSAAMAIENLFAG